MTAHRFSAHALAQMRRRGLAVELVESVLAEPHQCLSEAGSIEVLQSRIKSEETGGYLVRVFVRTDVEPQLVPSAYRTSKVEKYWRSE